MRLAWLGVMLLGAVPLYALDNPPAAPPAPMPTACGDMNIEFNADEGVSPAKTPEAGKAMIYFILDDGPWGEGQHYTIRMGMDGKWVGAYKHNSYFALLVDPGVHHLCGNVQTKLWYSGVVSLAHLNAEAGQTYYVRARFLSGTGDHAGAPYLDIDRPDSDEAQYLIGRLPVSIWKQKH